MGRELQKRKNRSSVPKVRQKLKSKKKILANPLIAANWNQSETLTQNYRRLGLVSNLNKRTGGIDKTPLPSSKTSSSSKVSEPASTSAFLINAPLTSSKTKTIQPTEVSVVRDPKTGAIISVTSPDDQNSNRLNDPLAELDSSEDDEEWDSHKLAHAPKATPAGTSEIVRQLEEQAKGGQRRAPRKQSEREQEWIGRLVEKYGEDYGRMARDMKMNPMQQTATDLKKRVAKWRKSQGE